jgi:signal transduction histidine kinase
MIKIRHSLSRKLSIGIVLLAIPIFVIALGLLFLQSRYLIQQETIESSQSLLNTTLQRVHNFMQTVETAANVNAWMMEENFTPSNIEKVSNRIVRLNGSVASCSVYALPNTFPQYGEKYSVYTKRTGDSLATFCEPDYDYFGKASYTKPKESGKACWVDPFIEYSDGNVDVRQAIATYCKPLRQKNGRMIGVVAVDFSFSMLAQLINSDELDYNRAYYMLIGGDGRYLIHPDSTRLFRKTLFSDADPSANSDLISLGYEMTAGKRGSLLVHNRSFPCRVFYEPIGGTNWSLALVIPERQLMSSYHNLGYVIVAILVFGLFGILWLTSRMVKQTVRPLSQLLDVTNRMIEGQYDDHLTVNIGTSRIARLQNSYAKMLMALHDKQDALHHHVDEARLRNEGLEQDVHQARENVIKKNRFMQQVAQHMRSPLNVITGFATMLRESGDHKEMIGQEDFENISTMMKSNAINLNSMVLMLFDASESDASEALLCEKNDEEAVNALARECITYTHTHFPQAHIEFSSTVSDTLCIVTNHIYLMRTLRELLYNAAKYSDGQHITLSVTDTENTICYTVEDVGPGLPDDKAETLFKPFTRDGDLAEGIGLGLTLALRHAKSLGGNLSIDTDYHQGCRVTLELPK